MVSLNRSPRNHEFDINVAKMGNYKVHRQAANSAANGKFHDTV